MLVKKKSCIVIDFFFKRLNINILFFGYFNQREEYYEQDLLAGLSLYLWRVLIDLMQERGSVHVIKKFPLFKD